jgi:hypothetical protein
VGNGEKAKRDKVIGERRKGKKQPCWVANKSEQSESLAVKRRIIYTYIFPAST